MKKLLYFFIVSLIFSSCSDDDNNAPIDSGEKFAMVVCEGIWSQNNSTLSRINLDSNSVIDGYFVTINNLELGDQAFSIVKNGDHILVTVSNSNKIEVINAQTGENINTIQLPDNSFPQKIVLDNGKGYVCLLTGNQIQSFDLNTYELIDTYQTGPNPSDFEIYNNKIYVVNSAFGVEGAENGKTIFIIDLTTKEKTIFETKDNPSEIAIDVNNNKLYVTYLGFYMKSNSGVSVFSLDSNLIISDEEYSITGRIEVYNGEAYLLAYETDFNKSTLYKLESGLPVVFIERTENMNRISNFYFNGDELILFDDYRLQADGKVFFYDTNFNLTQTYSVGLGPRSILFYEVSNK